MHKFVILLSTLITLNVCLCGYQQYVFFAIYTFEDGVFRITNTWKDYGKFYLPSKDDEIQPSVVDRFAFTNKFSALFGACGRSGSATGTNGGFTITRNGISVAVVEFDIPWRGPYKLYITEANEEGEVNNYNCRYEQGPDTSTLGRIDIECFKK